MKKLLSILFACLLVIPAASADYDFSTMPDDELLAVFNVARNEIITRAAKVSGKTFIIDQKEAVLYLTGKGRQSGSGFELEVVEINNTNDELMFSCECITINGWQLQGYDDIPLIKSGNKAFGAIYLDYRSVGLSDISEIEEVVIRKPYFVDLDRSYEHVATGPDFVIDFQGCDWE